MGVIAFATRNPAPPPVYSGVWTSRTAPNDNKWSCVTWSPEEAIFVALSTFDAVNPMCITSPDGITWTERTIPNGTWLDVAWSPTEGIFVGVQTLGNLATSPDGINWTTRTVSFSGDDMRAVTWSPDLSLFVLVKTSGTNRVATSPDGINWTDRSGPGDPYTWYDVVWSPEESLFCATSYNAGPTSRIMTSPDGTNWSLQTSIVTEQMHGVAWSPSLNLFAAVGGDVVQTSPDGVTWTNRPTTETGNFFRRIIWIPEMSKFVGAEHLMAKVAFSSDGITWEQSDCDDAYQWTDVAYSPSLRRIVIVGATSDGIYDTIMTSDGI